MSITPTATTTTVPAPLPRLAGGGLAGPVVHACAWCHQLDTTARGALWRVSPLVACLTACGVLQPLLPTLNVSRPV